MLCPRCLTNHYTPYGEQATEAAPFPALSRRDNTTYICSPCGNEEALADLAAFDAASPSEKRAASVRPGSTGLLR